VRCPSGTEAQLDSYLSTSLDHDIADLGASVRRPAALRAWLTAYGAATATTTSYNAILDAATAGETDKPARQTATAYRELLQRLWLLDAVPAWQPTLSPLRRLAHAPKHHLVDPALAARLVGATPDSLLRGTGAAVRVGDGTLLGARFESLAALSMRSICAVLDLRVSHFRTQNGDREVDFTFGTAADDPPYQQVYYTATYLVPVDVAILVGLAVVGLTGAGLRVLRRRPR
jgi:predicted AAA+ superfamily ATPase